MELTWKQRDLIEEIKEVLVDEQGYLGDEDDFDRCVHETIQNMCTYTDDCIDYVKWTNYDMFDKDVSDMDWHGAGQAALTELWFDEAGITFENYLYD